MAMDIEINALRNWSTNSSTNSFRVTLAHSSTSSTTYTKQI